MRVAVLSDIHSNLAALDAVMGSLGTVDAIWHLGDIVGYGPEPDAVVERLRAAGAVGVRGNHDAGVCGTFPIEWFNPEGRAAIEWTRGRMTAETRDYLAALPLSLEPPGSAFTLVHGSPRDPLVEYLFSAAAAGECLAEIGMPYCLVGHTHQPVWFRRRGGATTARPALAGTMLRLGQERLLLNPGSVGQPRDGNPLASYMILDLTARTATWHRVGYDIGATQAAIMAAGLPRFLGQRLALGA